ncbi:MAG: ABC transporter ATP-binding protein [Rhizobiales bacterium]|nr:ABC transporter ATP-binding protein [Hyphomicrobiales bacterium]
MSLAAPIDAAGAANSIEIRGLEVSYGALTILRELDLDIPEGEFLVLLGPSGCGKSTLLNAIAGLGEITGGQIFIDGDNVTWKDPKDRHIGMVFQSYALYPRMSVRENMSFGLRMQRVAAAEIDRRVAVASRMLHLDPLLDRRPAELSGGQRQRVAIGRALVKNVKVFLFDEPLSNLDAKLRAELRVEIKKLHRDLGTTMIYVTHDQIEALTLADRIAVMKDGVVQQLDRPEIVYATPVNRFVASFIGSPAMNFIPGRLTGQKGSPVFESGPVRIGLDGYAFAAEPPAGTDIELGIRPEHVRLGADAQAEPFNTTATIDLIEPMGADKLVWVTLADRPVAIRTASETTLPTSGSVRVGFAPKNVSLFDARSGRRL